VPRKALLTAQGIGERTATDLPFLAMLKMAEATESGYDI